MRDDKKCPDDEVCYYDCQERCRRVRTCGPVSGKFSDDVWPEWVLLQQGLVEEPGRPWYDSWSGLRRAIDRGLAGLHEICKARHVAGYARNERMHEWCLLGRYHMDRCGNAMTIVEGAPAETHGKRHLMFDVMTLDESRSVSNYWTSTFVPIPEEGDTCDRCFRGWDLHNAHDAIRSSRDGDLRHKNCHRLAVIEREQEMFRAMLKNAGVAYQSMRAIPSQYHNDDTYFGPWFVVETSRGSLVLGWRKRVIEIRWDRTSLTIDGAAVVAESWITHGATSCHAYGTEAATTCLKKLWASQGAP